MPLTKKQIETRKRLAKERREQAIEDYRKNPSHCKLCGSEIPLSKGKHAPVAETRRKKFCNHSCAAKFNNLGVDRWSTRRKFNARNELLSECQDCGKEVVNKPTPRKDRKSGLRYSVKNYCGDCRRRPKPDSLVATIENLSIGELTKKYGRLRARTHITKHARKVYLQSDRSRCCSICGFDFCFDVAHKKAVTDFHPDTKVSEINNLDNLIALCPNHHRMYDGGVINL